MNAIERIKMVKAMDFIARHINDEELIVNDWFANGVGDGDIEGGDLSVKDTDADDLDYYLEDENFADTMEVFLRVMRYAKKYGGLYCDGIVNKKPK